MPSFADSVIGFWQNFEGGHWGTVGAERANGNQYGGTNMLPTKSGGVTPVCASRPLTLSNARSAKVWGMFWPWGLDGNLYYLQNGASATTTTTTTATVFRFNPDPTSIPLTATDVGGVVTQPTVEPDWVNDANFIYITVYGDKTYKITSSTPSLTKLTGTYGDAPAGRAICMYGTRIVVGGINDSRFGNHPNRIVFSGDDTNNDPTLVTAWESLNFFDLGADGTPITGIYPIRDHLVVVLRDQQVYLVTGIPGTNATARRLYGFTKGAGSVTSYVAAHGATDPSQTEVWMFDHTYRAPARLSGTTLARVPNVGAPHGSRTATDLVEGPIAMIGGPGEFVVHGVAVNRLAGETTIGADLELVHLGGISAIVQRTVLSPRGN